MRGETWPNGFWRTEQPFNEATANTAGSGRDPLTPGVAALADAVRLDPATAPTFPHPRGGAIGRSREILEQFTGAPAPRISGWTLSSQFARGPAVRVRLRVHMNNGLKPACDVVARPPGAPRPTGPCPRHTSRRADCPAASIRHGASGASRARAKRWVRFGGSGNRSAPFGCGILGRRGIRPIGSTEYAEHRRKELQSEQSAINTDRYQMGAGRRRRVVTTRPAHRCRRIFPRDLEPPSARRQLAHLEVEFEIARKWGPTSCRSGLFGLPTLSIEFTGTGGAYAPTTRTTTRSFAARVADPGFARRPTGAPPGPWRCDSANRRFSRFVFPTTPLNWHNSSTRRRSRATQANHSPLPSISCRSRPR